jgi:hypothetical protein
MVMEYLDRAWTLWTGSDIIQATITVVVVVIVIVFAYSVVKAATSAKKPEGP